MIPALFIFIIAASAYMGASLGTSPYDAISYILADKIKKVPFRVVRICYDLVVCVAGWALGSTLRDYVIGTRTCHHMDDG